jgi:hypothetical protein
VGPVKVRPADAIVGADGRLSRISVDAPS